MTSRCVTATRRLTLRHTLAAPFGLLLSALPLTGHSNPYECLIEPFQVVEIRSPVEGLIDKIHVKRGDRVQAGQVLVELDSAVEAAAVEAARYRAQMQGRLATSKHRIDYATKKFGRLQKLQIDNYVSAQARDEAEAEKRIAESEMAEAQENRELAAREYKQAVDVLNRRSLRSPFNGVVVDRMLNRGDLAEAGTGRKAIMKLAQVEPLRVEVVLPVAAFRKVRVGSTAEVVPEGLGGRYPAKVTVVDSVFDSASGSFGVRLELPNPKGALPAGIRCKVEFQDLKTLPVKGKG